VTVFFDWQNVYKRARDAFEHPENAPSHKGQADPVELAMLLVERHQAQFPGATFALEQIRIYRGRPLANRDQGGYNSFQRQTSIWAQNAKVVPKYRDLRYPEDWGMEGCTDKPREKGVDVALAVDLVTLARDEAYDVAILMSADFDLVPAVEHLVRRSLASSSAPSIAVAAWKGAHENRPLKLHLKDLPLWCHWLSQEDFWGVEDTRDYSEPTLPRGPTTATPGSWLQR
jgi:hypothetical protein